jgi:hypothetical protein
MLSIYRCCEKRHHVYINIFILDVELRTATKDCNYF